MLMSLLPAQSTVASRVPFGGKSTFLYVALPGRRLNAAPETRTVRVGCGSVVGGVPPLGEDEPPQPARMAATNRDDRLLRFITRRLLLGWFKP
jgi:hypothetical protein